MSKLEELYKQVTSCEWAVILFRIEKGHIDGGEELYVMSTNALVDKVQEWLDGGEFVEDFLIPGAEKKSYGDGWYNCMARLVFEPGQVGNYPPPNVEIASGYYCEEVYIIPVSLDEAPDPDSEPQDRANYASQRSNLRLKGSREERQLNEQATPYSYRQDSHTRFIGAWTARIPRRQGIHPMAEQAL